MLLWIFYFKIISCFPVFVQWNIKYPSPYNSLFPHYLFSPYCCCFLNLYTFKRHFQLLMANLVLLKNILFCPQEIFLYSIVWHLKFNMSIFSNLTSVTDMLHSVLFFLISDNINSILLKAQVKNLAAILGASLPTSSHSPTMIHQQRLCALPWKYPESNYSSLSH